MPGRFSKRYEVDVEDVERLVNCIVEHATEDEGRQAERLLAMLTMLRATAEEHGDPAIAFAAPRGTSGLVDRALGAMARSDKHVARAARHRPRRPRAERDAAFRRAPRTAL
jgi:hypothetical protein